MERDPLNGEKVQLRELESHDLYLLKIWRNRWDVRSETREYRLLTMRHQEAWFDGLRDDGNTLMFGIMPIIASEPETAVPPEVERGLLYTGDVRVGRRERYLVGVCGLTYIDWRNGHTEISCYIGEPENRRKGYYSDALEILTRYAFDELRLHMVWGEIYGWNEAAIEACAKLGFRREGPIRDRVFRFGKWWGSYFISKTESEWREDIS